MPARPGGLGRGGTPMELASLPASLDEKTSALVRRGLASLRSGEYGAALRSLRGALRRRPEVVQLENALALALCRRNRLGEARLRLEHCCREASGSWIYPYNLAMVLTREGDLAAAVVRLDEAVARLSPSPDSAAALGEVYARRAALQYALEDFDQSLRDFREALRLGADSAEHYIDAGCAAEEAGRFDEAEGYFEAAVEGRPGDAAARFFLARVLDRQGKKRRALELLTALEAERPAFFEARLLRATILASLRPQGSQYRDEAIAALEALVRDENVIRRHEGQLDGPYVLLGSLYDDLPEEYPRAIEAYQRGVAINPDHAIAHNNLGAIYLERHETGKALEHFKKALLVNPDYTKAYLNLARLYYHHRTERQLQEELARLIDEAPDAAARLLMGLTVHIADIAQREAYEDFYSRGHKLKNLLAVQGSRLHRLRRKVGDPSLAERVENLVASNEEMYDWILGYLKVIRPQPLRPAPVDLSALVARVIERLRAGLPEGVELIVDLASDCPPLAADGDRLAEALENLWTNAVDALEGREGSLTVATGVDAKRVELWLSVSDTGPGIGPDMLQKILRTGFTTKTMGSGLGLAIVRRVAADHYGMIEVRSSPGEGATFTLRLPVKAEIRARRASIAMRPLLSIDTCSLIVDELA